MLKLSNNVKHALSLRLQVTSLPHSKNLPGETLSVDEDLGKKPYQRRQKKKNVKEICTGILNGRETD